MSGQPRIALVDYGSGNLRSVEKALEVCGARVVRAVSHEILETVEAVVVPGVGAFGDCAENLRRAGMWEPLHDWLRQGFPFLGICLGYQLLFESSEESPGVRGWGILPGSVVRFQGAGLKVPHMGWNSLSGLGGPLFRGFESEPWVYFVHSYYPKVDEEGFVSSFCDYGQRFAASVSVGRIHATQFHPEKSQECGLRILKGFIGTL